MEIVEVFQKTYGLGYNEVMRLTELANAHYTVCLVSYANSIGNDSKIEKAWPGLTLQQAVKWQWYFRHVAAKMQLAAPRRVFCFVVHRTRTAIDDLTQLKQSLLNKLTSAKGKLTSVNKRLFQIRAGWRELFPIEEHPEYQKALEEVQRRKDRIDEIEADIKLLASDRNAVIELLKKHPI